jgi:hypothetical protein
MPLFLESAACFASKLTGLVGGAWFVTTDRGNARAGGTPFVNGVCPPRTLALTGAICAVRMTSPRCRADAGTATPAVAML